MEVRKLEEWYAAAKQYDWEGHTIAYQIEESDKPWLVLIHGFPTASFDWHKTWNQLSARFSLIAPDMLGFGYSDKPTKFPYSIMKQADLIEALLEKLEIESCHLLAHDYGDTVTQELLARSNEESKLKIESTCLLNGGIFPESHHPIMIQKLLMSPIGPLLSKFINQKTFEKSFSSIFGPQTELSKEELGEYWKLVSYKEGHRIGHLIIRYMKERVKHRERWVAALQNFSKPLGLINGSADPISGQVMVDRYREIISEKNIWIMKNIGHYPQMEDSDQLIRCYLEFLAKNQIADRTS